MMGAVSSNLHGIFGGQGRYRQVVRVLSNMLQVPLNVPLHTCCLPGSPRCGAATCQVSPESDGRVATLGDGDEHGSAEDVLEAAVPGGVPPVSPDAGDMGTSAHINPAAGAHNLDPGHVGW